MQFGIEVLGTPYSTPGCGWDVNQGVGGMLINWISRSEALGR